MLSKKEKLYEGKAKMLYKTEKPGVLWLEYKNSLTAFNGEKKAALEDKGKFTNLISCKLFDHLAKQGVQSHFIEKLSNTEQLVHETHIIPIEVVVRNIAAGSICKRLGIPAKMKLAHPLVEFYYKDDDLNDPIITEDHARLFNWATDEEIHIIKSKALEVNTLLSKLFEGLNIILVDFKLEFGKKNNGEVILSDEISPDTCRFWDAKTMDKLDKDRFREDLGNVLYAYEEILNRLNAN